MRGATGDEMEGFYLQGVTKGFVNSGFSRGCSCYLWHGFAAFGFRRFRASEGLGFKVAGAQLSAQWFRDLWFRVLGVGELRVEAVQGLGVLGFRVPWVMGSMLGPELAVVLCPMIPSKTVLG